MTVRKNILLMTATVIPMASGGTRTRRADPGLRRADYEQALRFYLSEPPGPIDGIVFCENSGADLESLRDIARRHNVYGVPVEFISTVADCPAEYGKGHAELQMMDHAYHAIMARGSGATRYWKVTGRVIISNIRKIIRSAPPGFQLCIDLRLVPAFLRCFGTDRWADTRIFAFTAEGYREHLLGRRDGVGTPGNSHTVELALFDALYESSKAGLGVVPRLRTQPVMIGVGAESLKDYSDLAGRLKRRVRQFTRGVVPWLWL